MGNTSATWSISLDCNCPKCDHYFDVLDTPDFWDGRELDIGEHLTERSDNIETYCPECGHEFAVDCEY